MAFDCTKLKNFIEHEYFLNAMAVVVFINLITMGIATWEKIVEKTGVLFNVIDYIFLAIYSLEIILKFIVYKLCFFNSFWNIFDLIIVIISAIPDIPNVQALRSIRAIKAIRGFKFLNKIKQLRSVVEVTIKSISDIMWAFFLIIIFFYVFGLVGVNLFGQIQPEYFGTLPKALFTLTQIMTFEGFCADIARPLIREQWWASLYFIFFSIIAGFILINVMIGVICSSYDKVYQSEKREKALKDKLAHVNDDQLEESLELNNMKFNEAADGIECLIYAIDEKLSKNTTA